jgi:Mlc titration factor MtfA (ptsG expression regulator)
VTARWLQALRAPLATWRAHAQARALARRAIPDDLWKRTRIRYPFLQRRDPADEATLRRMTSLFLDRKEFSAAGGLRMSNDVVVAIAAQACLPVLRLGLERYDGFVGIVVHPDPVRVRRQVVDDAGVQHEYDEELAGEAMQGGPVMLSWHDVRRAGRDTGSPYNVVIHEFAHVLDLADGLSDGVPLLPANLPRARWTSVMAQAFEDLVRRVDAGEETVLDPYGAQGQDEFFAVASEAFFVAPKALRAAEPPLYDLLAQFYRQDPAVELPEGTAQRPPTFLG